MIDVEGYRDSMRVKWASGKQRFRERDIQRVLKSAKKHTVIKSGNGT